MATKKHHTAETSRLSWQQCINEGLPIIEKRLVLKYLTDEVEPKTSREISNALRKERTNITRTLNSLVKKGSIIISKYDTCSTTKRKVGHYTINQ